MSPPPVGNPQLGSALVSIAAALLAALLLPGCQRAEPRLAAPSQKIGQGITLRYWAPGWLGGLPAQQTGSLELYEKLEEVTGIHIEMTHPVTTDARYQLEELRSSGVMPDIMEWSWLRSYPGGPGKAIDDGLIISLGEIIPRHAPNLFRLLTEHPEVARAISTPDGRYYAFPDLVTDPSTRSQSGPLFRKDWLDKVGMQPPETIDQWREVLRAFKTAAFDTPGGGLEYPFFILTVVPWMQDDLTLPYFVESNAFAGAYGVAHGFYRRNGKMEYGAAQPEYRQMLELLASWHQEGLVHPAIAEPKQSRDWIEVIAKCGAWIGGTDAAEYLRPLKYVPAPLPRLDGSGGSAQGFLGPTIPPAYVGERAAAVSASSRYQTEAVRWLDVGYGAWGNRLYNFGIEGKSYELQRGAPVLADGAVREIARAQGPSLGLLQALYRFSRGRAGGPFDLSVELHRQYTEATMPGSSGVFLGWQAGSLVDPLSVLDADAERRGELERLYAPIREHHFRNVTAFISGQRSLGEFDRFARELDELGLAKVLELIERGDAAWRSKRALVR